MKEPIQDHPPLNNLSPEVVDLLRASLRTWVRVDDGADGSQLKSALHTVATDARDRGVRAEELLVVLKSTWYELGGTATPPSSGGNKRLDELVTACIKAYYG